MSKYKVTTIITLEVEVLANSEAQAIEIAKESFDIEMHLDELESSTKFTKAKLDDTEDESEDMDNSYHSDDDEEEED